MVVVLLAAFPASFGTALAAKRVALVIGNAAYEAVAALPNPAVDAAAFAAMLREARFDSVELRTDVTLATFRAALRDFTSAAADSDVAVFYYAGHGLEVGGENLLVPVDAHLQTDLDAEDETVTVDRVLRAMEPARTLRLVVLDACRDNPFLATMRRVNASRSVSRGLQRIDTPEADTMIAYATEPGAIADDGSGSHSPFTKALLDDLVVPGLDVRLALGKVRDDVLKETRGRQRPFVSGSLGGASLALVETPSAASPGGMPAMTPPPSKSATTPENPAADYATAEATNTMAAWQAFLRLHPEGPLAGRARDRIVLLTPGLAHSQMPSGVTNKPTASDAGPQPLSTLTFAYRVGGLDPAGDNFLALRSGPSGSAPMLRRLESGTLLAVLARNGAWVRVATPDEVQGWVSESFVRPSENQVAAPRSEFDNFVTGLDLAGDNFLALKSEPDPRSERLAKMGPGTRLSVDGRSGTWLHVRLPDGRSGWAAARYVGCCSR